MKGLTIEVLNCECCSFKTKEAALTGLNKLANEDNHVDHAIPTGTCLPCQDLCKRLAEDGILCNFVRSIHNQDFVY